MSFPRILVITSLILFSAIGVTALLKKTGSKEISSNFNMIEIELEDNTEVEPEPESIVDSNEGEGQFFIDDKVDIVDKFFNTGKDKFPFMETLTYKSVVPWKKGKVAFVDDYSYHYKTSRDFIARSLNGRAKYEVPIVSDGRNKFNVFKGDSDVSFYLFVDVERCKMHFYCVDGSEKILVKTYDVMLGKEDGSKESGCLTPLGRYPLGDNVDVYPPGKMGYFKGELTEMIKPFGSRWIPFGADGFGIHGMPCGIVDGKVEENLDGLGGYGSEGCIRLKNSDVKELYAIITKKSSIRPTTIEIVPSVNAVR